MLSSIGLLINLPNLYIQCIQDVTFPERKTFLNENNINIKASSNTLSFNELLIEDLYINFFISQKININNNPINSDLIELKSYVEFSKIQDIFRFLNENDSSSITGILIPDEEIKMNPNNYNDNSMALLNSPSFFYTKINNFKLELYYNPVNTLAQSSVIFNLGNFNISIINQSLELLSASLLRWINFIKSLLNIIDNFDNNNKKLQKIVATVVKESKRLKIISNPTFLTQPSPMWRLGSSHHKSDPGWKLLFHIRYAMKELQKRPENILKTLIPINDSNTLYNITMKNLIDWYNWENISENCNIFNLIFNKKISNASNLNEQGAKDVSNYIPNNLRICLQIGKVQLLVYDNKIEKNNISITPTQMDLIVKPKELISNNNQIANDLDKFYYDILYYGGIGRINIILNSNLFILAKHSIRAIGWLSSLSEKQKVKPINNTSTIKESIKTLSSKGKKHQGMNIFHGLFTIKSISIKISASTLELKCKLKNSSLSTYNLMFDTNDENQISTIENLSLHCYEKAVTTQDPSKMIIIQHNTIFKVSSMSTNLIEKNLISNGKPIKNELAEINFNNFNIHGGLNRAQNSKKISFLLTLGSLNVNVLKSIILLYSCFDNWSNEYLDKYKYLIEGMMNEINSNDSNNLEDNSLSISNDETKDENFKLLDDVDISLLNDFSIGLKVIFNSINIRMDLFSSAGLIIDFPNYYIELSKADNNSSSNTVMYLYSVNISSPKIKLNITKSNYIESDENNFVSELPQFNISGMLVTDSSNKNLGLNIKLNVILNKYHCRITSSIIKEGILLPYLVKDELEQIKKIYDKFSINQNNEEALKVVEDKTKNEKKKNIFELYDIKLYLNFFLQDFQISVQSDTENIAFDITGLHGKFKINDFSNITEENEISINKNKILGEISSKNICLSFNSISNTTNQINNRLAYLVIDLSLNNNFIIVNNNKKQSFNLIIQDVHSVLHIISIEKFLKFLIFFKTEITKVQNTYSQKKNDHNEYLYDDLHIKNEYNKELIQKIETKETDVSKSNEPNIFDNILINVTVSRVASIIPLVDVNTSDTASLIKNNGKVLFLYLRLLKFNSDLLKDESSLVFCDIFFQFIESFDLTNQKHFSPLAHPVENRLVLPNCKFTLKTQKNEKDEDVYFLKNTNKGLIINLDYSLSTYIDLLVKMYYRGSKKFIAYAPLFDDSNNNTDANKYNSKKDESNNEQEETKENQNQDQTLFDLSILHKVKFESELEPSVIKIVSKNEENNSNGNFDSNKTNNHTINFPHVGLYLHINKNVNNELIDCSTTNYDQIFFNINIFKSENYIKPLILQFIDQLIIDLESTNKLIQSFNHGEPVKPTVIKEKQKPSNNTSINNIFEMFIGHIICINLNVNETKIGLSCQPSNKVSCILGFNNFSFTTVYSLDNEKNHSLISSLNLHDLSLVINNAYSPEHFFDICFTKIILNYTIIRDKNEINDYSNIGQFNIPLIKLGFNIRYLQDFLEFYDIWFNSKLLQNLDRDDQNEFENHNDNKIIINNDSSANKNISNIDKRKSSIDFADYLSFSDHNLSFYLLANIGHVQCIYDLSQITGQGEVNLNTLNLSYNKIYRQHIPRFNTDFHINNFSFTTEGKLQGFININNIVLNADIRNPILSLSKDNNSYSVLSLNKIGKIYSDLRYQYDRTFLLDITDIYLVTSDQYQLNDKPKLFLKNDIVIKYIKLCISKKTIAMIMNIINKFSSFIKEKQLTFSTSKNKKSMSLNDKNTQEKKTTANKIKKIAYDYIFDQSSKIFCSLYGVFSITLEKALIVAFRYDFKDPDSVKLDSNKLILDVKLNYNTQQVIMKEDINKIFEEVKFSCEGIKVVKGSYKFVTKQNENTLNIDEWFSYLDESPSKNILNIPKSIMQLNGNKYIKDKLVEYVFESSFSEPIDVALNFGLYIYLVNIIKLYLSTINSDSSNTQASTTDNIDYNIETTSKKQDQTSNNSTIDEDKKKLKEYKKQINEEINIMSKKHQDLFKSSQEEEENIVFKAIKPILLEPQLKVIGDATSWEWVDYIGVNKESIPVELYKLLINNFELLFNSICQVYGMVSIPLESSKKK